MSEKGVGMVAALTGAYESPARDRWGALRRFAMPRPVRERCELCGVDLPAEHDHLVEPATRQLLCSCQACAILFDHEGDTKYRRIPRDSQFLSDFQLTDQQWNGLSIPIGLAFIFRSTAAGKVVAIYPSPAGPTESLLELECWGEIVAANPSLDGMQPDTEALLVNRLGSSREYFRTPIDECYKLVGLIRTHWHGFSGGSELWGEVEGFLAALKSRTFRR